MSAATTLLRVFLVTTLLGGLLPASVAAQVRAVETVYSFGDSFSDTGNIFAGSKAIGLDPAVPPSESPRMTYYNGRFSNGPVAVEYLVQLLTGNAPGSAGGLQPILSAAGSRLAGSVDFAFGGTGTPYLDRIPNGMWAPGLKGQVELFRTALRGRKPAKRALYVIATGSNDYRDDAFNVPMAPTEVVQNILEAVATLYDLGAREVMVFDLPNLGLLPGGDPTGPGAQLSLEHNRLLAEGLASLAAERHQLHIIPIHLNDLFPVLFGMGFEVTTPALALLLPDPSPTGVPSYACLFVLPAACQDANFDVTGQLGIPFVFWDIVHPTTDTHRVLGEFLFDALYP